MTTGSAARIGDDIRGQLATAGLDPGAVEELIASAIDEDLDGGVDVTTVSTVPADQRATLDLVARRDGVVAGAPVAAAVFAFVCGDDAAIRQVVVDGSSVAAGDTILSITGRTHDLLQAERPALNLLGHLSGIATLTRVWVDAIAGTGAAVRDTRKTTPGMRRLEKYAVRCGGGAGEGQPCRRCRRCGRRVRGRSRPVPRGRCRGGGGLARSARRGAGRGR